MGRMRRRTTKDFETVPGRMANIKITMRAEGVDPNDYLWLKSDKPSKNRQLYYNAFFIGDLMKEAKVEEQQTTGVKWQVLYAR